MKVFCILIFLCVSINLQAHQAVDQIIMEMYASDVAVREKVIKVGFSSVTQELADELKETDIKNTSKLKSIIDDIGWNGLFGLKLELLEAAILIIEHADEDFDFQKEALEKVIDAHKAGIVEGQDLALLTDKVLLAQGKPQLYGTQIEITDSKIQPFPMTDEATVDERRSEVGLPPMDEYMKIIREVYKN